VICGAVKPVDGRHDPLVCTLEAPHDGVDHGVAVHPDLPPFVTWPETWEVQPPYDWHAGWRKPHTRRPYETTAMWKARQ
jgi:hypothetical protein